MSRAGELCRIMEYWASHAEELEKQYPGVRPGWVSTDISLAWARYNKLKSELEALETSGDTSG